MMVILSRSPDFTAVLILAMVHLAILVFHIFLSANLTKTIDSSFIDFLGEGNLSREDVAHVGELFGLIENAFITSPPALIKTASLEGKAKAVAVRLNALIKDMNDMDAAITLALSNAPNFLSGSKTANLTLFINTLVDDLEGLSKGSAPKGRYDNRLKDVIGAVRDNYLQLAQNRKAIDNTLEAVKKNSSNLLPDTPLSEELKQLMQNISNLETALSRLAQFNLEPGSDGFSKGFKSADMVSSIQSGYSTALWDISGAIDFANSSSGSLANEIRMLNNNLADEKRLITQLRDSVKTISAQLKSGREAGQLTSSKLDNVMQLAEKIYENKGEGLKSAGHISNYTKSISGDLSSALKGLTKFRIVNSKGQEYGSIRGTIRSQPNRTGVAATGQKPGQEPTGPIKAKPRSKAAPPMLPRHYGKIPESGYNFDNKDYGKYSR